MHKSLKGGSCLRFALVEELAQTSPKAVEVGLDAVEFVKEPDGVFPAEAGHGDGSPEVLQLVRLHAPAHYAN